jgi:hypothetical protein
VKKWVGVGSGGGRGVVNEKLVAGSARWAEAVRADCRRRVGWGWRAGVKRHLRRVRGDMVAPGRQRIAGELRRGMVGRDEGAIKGR